LRAGFPHSEIFGSKLACQLPEAYRRLQRPSSPVVAKASTTCTYSLDPITLNTDVKDYRERLLHTITQRPRNRNISRSLYFIRVVKEQPMHKAHRKIASKLRPQFCVALWKTGGANRDRTDDLLLAKQALSQLSYGPEPHCLGARWWVWMGSNHRPPPYQDGALTS
jgi:hypothetical protein